jgi:hypothetical protein
MNYVKSTILTILVTPVLVTAAMSQDSVKLNVQGTIVASEKQFGHIYDEEEINSSLYIVRVGDEAKGHVSSRFILVKHKWRLKDDLIRLDSKYSQWKFGLVKDTTCNSSIKEIQFVWFGNTKKPSGMMPRFRRSSFLNAGQIPFIPKLPCYLFRPEKSEPVISSVITSESAAKTDMEAFVLETDRWINIIGSPIRIGLSGAGMLTFTNITRTPVSSFWLACVDDLMLTKNRPPEKVRELKTSLPAGSSTPTTFNSIGTDDYMQEMKTCHDKGLKLGIGSVTFSDNTVWELNSR